MCGLRKEKTTVSAKEFLAWLEATPATTTDGRKAFGFTTLPAAPSRRQSKTFSFSEKKRNSCSISSNYAAEFIC